MVPLAALATLVSFAVDGNRVQLQLDHGSAELVWVGEKSFRFRRSLDGALPPAAPEPAAAPVTFQVDDTPAALRLRTRYLDVAIEKRAVLVAVRDLAGAPLAADLSEPHMTAAGISWERAAPAGVRLYGLGGGDGLEFNLRGKKISSLSPFLLSSAGYGEQHSSLAAFDFTAPDRYKIEAPAVDYYFFYGPTPKEIFKQRIPRESLPLLDGPLPPASWDALRSQFIDTIHRLMSSSIVRTIRFRDAEKAPDDLQSRIRQVQSLIPDSLPSFIGTSAFRRQLNSFFDIYAIELRDEHHPIWHALPFQFPEDPECAHHADEFMLGDEMLIAPIYTTGNKRQVYLPPGTWTSLETNQQYEGRRTIPVETPALPVFAHNGAIVPLDSEGGIGLHYFPKAGGEFFLLEKETGQYTQIHAAPALDIMRLEIDSHKERDYQWVVHHVEPPTGVVVEDAKLASVAAPASLTNRTWFYDAAQKNLMIRVRVKAGEDSIVNISW